jgi:ankyrin repeat protein
MSKALNDGRTPLFMAAQEGHDAVVAVLLRAGSDINCPMADGCTPFMIATHEGHKAVVMTLEHWMAS